MIGIIDCGTSYLDIFQNHISDLGQSSRIIHLKELGRCDVHPFSGIIISGAPTLLTQVNLPDYLTPFKFVKEAAVPILGICNGHQVIGLLYGSKIHRTAEVHKKENIELLMKDALFAGLEGSPAFQENHSEHISLPEEFVLLAKSSTCNNEAMRHKQKRIYGLQFHPEVSGQNGQIVLKNFVEMCYQPS